MKSAWTFGTLPDGQDVTAYRLTADNGMEAVILDYGLILQSLTLPNGRNVTLGYTSLEDYLTGQDYRGAIIGPNANRIVGAKYEIDGTRYDLCANHGLNNLHSGLEGFDRQMWSIKQENDCLKATHSSKPNSAFAGHLETEISFSLTNDRLRVDMRAQTDQAMPVNLTWHPYWNLAGDGRIDGHDLQINSDLRTELESGEVHDVSRTRFDFRTPLPLGHVRLDNNYRAAKSAVLIYEQTWLEVTSSLPDLQVYTGDALPKPRSGIAIEPQFQPNDINLDQRCLLRHGETYDHWIEYRFTGLE